MKSDREFLALYVSSTRTPALTGKLIPGNTNKLSHKTQLSVIFLPGNFVPIWQATVSNLRFRIACRSSPFRKHQRNMSAREHPSHPRPLFFFPFGFLVPLSYLHACGGSIYADLDDTMHMFLRLGQLCRFHVCWRQTTHGRYFSWPVGYATTVCQGVILRLW